MQISLTATYDLLARHGIFAREACDRCGQVLGAVRYTRHGELGVWCSQVCRGDAERPATRRGGRPRKYRTPEDCRSAKTAQQREYHNVAVWKKPPHTQTETKDLRTQKVPLSYHPLTRILRSEMVPSEMLRTGGDSNRLMKQTLRGS